MKNKKKLCKGKLYYLTADFVLVRWIYDGLRQSNACFNSILFSTHYVFSKPYYTSMEKTIGSHLSIVRCMLNRDTGTFFFIPAGYDCVWKIIKNSKMILLRRWTDILNVYFDTVATLFFNEPSREAGKWWLFVRINYRFILFFFLQM